MNSQWLEDEHEEDNDHALQASQSVQVDTSGASAVWLAARRRVRPLRIQLSLLEASVHLPDQWANPGFSYQGRTSEGEMTALSGVDVASLFREHAVFPECPTAAAVPTRLGCRSEFILPCNDGPMLSVPLALSWKVG